MSAAAYDRTVAIGEASVRIVLGDDGIVVHHDGARVHDVQAGSGLGRDVFVFTVRERGREVTYDLQVHRAAQGIHCFLGREGTLVFSDAPGFRFEPPATHIAERRSRDA